MADAEEKLDAIAEKLTAQVTALDSKDTKITEKFAEVKTSMKTEFAEKFAAMDTKNAEKFAEVKTDLKALDEKVITF